MFRYSFYVGKLTARIEDEVAHKKGSLEMVQILHPVSEWLKLYLFGKPWTSQAKLTTSPWCRGYSSHSRSSEGPPFNISAYSRIFYFISVCYFLAHTGLLFLLVFKQNLCSLRSTFSFNKNIRDFSLNFGGLWKLLFDRFVVCNLSVYLLGLALANPCFRTTSIFKCIL
jgi:hypothetical protein